MHFIPHNPLLGIAMVEMLVFVLKFKHESTCLNLLQVPQVEKSCLRIIVEMFLIDHRFA
jgi:hypothetical protein